MATDIWFWCTAFLLAVVVTLFALMYLHADRPDFEMDWTPLRRALRALAESERHAFTEMKRRW